MGDHTKNLSVKKDIRLPAATSLLIPTAIVNAEFVDMLEKTYVTENGEPPLDFRGQWKTESGYFAEVRSRFLNYWLGLVRMPDGQWIPTFWNLNGNSINPLLNLVQKRRGVEVWNIN